MFDDYFEVFIADTTESREKHYSVRNKVFSSTLSRKKAQVESDSSNSQSPVDLSVMDKWDDNAIHFIVRDKRSDEYVGAMRLVFQKQGFLPVVENDTLFHPIPENELSDSVELSRLCLLDEVRHQKNDGLNKFNLANKTESFTESDKIVSLSDKRNFHKSIIWGLFRAAAIYSYERGVTNWYFTTYKALARLISREGFNMDCVGRSSKNARGERLPYKMTVSDIFSQIDMTPSTNMSLRSYSRGYQWYSKVQQDYRIQQTIEALALAG